MTRLRYGKRSAGKDPKGEAREAFSRFAKNPLAPEARSHLREAVKAIDEIPDAAARRDEADTIAQDVFELINRAQEREMRPVAEAIGSELLNESAFCEAVSRKARQERGAVAGTACGRAGNGDTASFRIHIERLIRENPRFAGLGRVMVDLEDGDHVRVHNRGGPSMAVMPWWKRKRKELIAGTVAAGVLIAGIVLGNAMKDEPARNGIITETRPAASQPKEEEPPNRITPDNLVVLDAIRKAVKKADNLNMRQIFDVYEHVVKNIKYLDIADPSVPRWPEETLRSGIGDCKSMASLLASMLEGMGAKTILIDWYDPASKDGHMYVGVMVSDEDANKRKAAARSIRNKIYREYRPKIRRAFGQNRLPIIRFREVASGGSTHLYLLLDPTLGESAIPGLALPKPSLENVAESRPGKSGYRPKLI
jgi:Transglutaminase-like superfamily